MSPSAGTGLRVEHAEGTWTFTLDRPEKMNALSSALVEALIAGVQAAHEGGARLLVFRGAGRNFSAGFDFGGLEEASHGDLLLRFVRVETLLHLIATSPAATLALAHGRNFGAGVDLIAACRRRVATADATFRMPGLKFGLVLGTRRFASLVGREAARDILETARQFPAQEASAIGFLTATAAVDQWPALIEAAARDAAALPDASRAALYAATWDENADGDLAALVRSAAAPGLKARIRAYVEAGRAKASA
jgi:enoyl-CoA hydratase/carnithine racemase